MPETLEPVIPVLQIPVSLDSRLTGNVESGSTNGFPKFDSVSPGLSSSFDLNPKERFPCSTAELGLKKVKLGIDGIGDEKSGVVDSQQLLKEKPPYPEQGVVSSTTKVENDDLQVNAGDCPN